VVRAVAASLGLPDADVEVKGWRDKEGEEDYVDTTICWSKKVGDLWPCKGEGDEAETM
jgi:hypothetical protein